MKGVDCLLLSVYLVLTVGLPFTYVRYPLTTEENDELNSYALHIRARIPCTGCYVFLAHWILGDPLHTGVMCLLHIKCYVSLAHWVDVPLSTICSVDFSFFFIEIIIKNKYRSSYFLNVGKKKNKSKYILEPKTEHKSKPVTELNRVISLVVPTRLKIPVYATACNIFR